MQGEKLYQLHTETATAVWINVNKIELLKTEHLLYAKNHWPT